ncbi:3-oxoadipyl-CoA thiolase [Flavobacterium franklandianum]|uniref:Beta-ketoadipyl-CoA thiolase n=1 Tax=Flavobacterium franklandianum TaxID=2594430 RepID=A0A553CLM7_9FLAO|nr:3-oxoadipyl-CoA thiolase [Flavobacterium franklandianum]TRX21361.1 3-oxoadipyl-CoA thiolase [Flavobacterium franklandianum]TRX29994.1 3-oxoadipyl-CoA thiolase [Flavobacterium franklandianum]
MNQSYIIDAIRTPVGSFGGSLSTVRADDLAALTIRELVKRNPNIPVEKIDEVILGNHNQAGEDNRNVARMATLLAGLPYTVPAQTVNRLCASGMSAVIDASRSIQVGDADIMIAGGMEHMTRSPWVISKTSKPFGNDAKMFDSSFGWRFVNPKMEAMYGTDAMGITAENLVEMYHISREDQDLFAYNSQQKAFKAQYDGRFDEEIIAVELTDKKGIVTVFSKDEFIKGNTTLEKLATLRAAFKKDSGSVTAGNAAGLNDGSAALFLASEKAIKQYNLKPLARIVSSAIVGVEPRIMGIGPVGATQKALQKAGLTLDDIDIIELNEAFAAQALACTRALGLNDNDARVNPNGGAIALGHPLGMSGTRLIQTAAIELQKQNKRFALCAMCIGVGMGYAVIIENVNVK